MPMITMNAAFRQMGKDRRRELLGWLEEKAKVAPAAGPEVRIIEVHGPHVPGEERSTIVDCPSTGPRGPQRY